MSHDHFDHNCVTLVSGSDTSVIRKPIMTVERGVRVEGIPAFHDTSGGSKRGQITIFKFELDGTTFCHLGDLGHKLDEAAVEKISPVDILFVPTGDVFTVGPDSAKAVIDSLSPKVAIPMHYRMPGMTLSIQPIQNFLRLCDQKSVVKVGNEVEFSKDELPESGTEVWVFST
jgi:L-ascorbate metabolism protein UlaG (beta-lactamase superfamily)